MDVRLNGGTEFLLRMAVRRLYDITDVLTIKEPLMVWKMSGSSDERRQVYPTQSCQSDAMCFQSALLFIEMSSHRSHFIQ